VKDIFLCHSGSDDEWVETLAARLEKEPYQGRTLQAFVDGWDIDFGENVLGRIEQGLRDSRFFAVVMSPNWTAADWPRLEWQSQVHADPAGRSARILPILLHRADPNSGEALEIPLPLRLLRWFDFSDPRNFEREYQELVRRLKGERPARGGGAGPLQHHNDWPGRDEPTGGEEALLSNLLEVHRYPPLLYSDITTAKRKSDVWVALAGARIPPFLLHEGRLYSFFSPRHPANPFKRFLTGGAPGQTPTIDWLRDPDGSRRLIGLLNEALKEHCYHLGIRRPRRAGDEPTSRAQYFCPMHNGRPRLFRWREGARPRTLSKVVIGPKNTSLGVHYAADLRFQNLDNQLYLAIEPGWFFTTDGSTPLEGKQVSVFSTKWGGRERNAAVLRNLFMWAILLSGGAEDIRIDVGGGQALEIIRVPAHAHIGAGIEGDSVPLDGMLGGAGAGEMQSDDNAAQEAEDELGLDQAALLRMANLLSDPALDGDDDFDAAEIS
jgi:hypothetical protein